MKTRVIGCPKTIDGDLKCKEVPTSFGFDTACKVIINIKQKFPLCFVYVSSFLFSYYDINYIEKKKSHTQYTKLSLLWELCIWMFFFSLQQMVKGGIWTQVLHQKTEQCHWAMNLLAIIHELCNVMWSHFLEIYFLNINMLLKWMLSLRGTWNPPCLYS